ncbi:hypothetical protein AMECASPLE_007001 [Ameca splendens]|uniref:Uncharacterized protein n=1 Tax=Ameca splendens TaxID=208324 RepID=A0ABV0XZH8_9TELE
MEHHQHLQPDPIMHPTTAASSVNFTRIEIHEYVLCHLSKIDSIPISGGRWRRALHHAYHGASVNYHVD